jgi:hypothetical protein
MARRIRPPLRDSITPPAEAARQIEQAEELERMRRGEARQADRGARGEDMLTTAIHIRRSTWELLRAAAFKRAMATGGRASVSAFIDDLVERHRDELTSEA